MMFLRPLFFVAMMLAAFPAQATESAWATQDYVQARLVSAVSGHGQQDSFEGGLELRLAEGWHAYWRMPGDSGLPPRLNWDGSGNVKSITVEWPVPTRFETLDLYGFGYTDHVLWPFTVEVKDPAKDAVLNLEADIMVCEDICVPQKVSLSMTVPANHEGSTISTALVKNAFSRLAATESNEKLRIENVVIGPEAIVLNAYSRRGFDNFDVFVESGDDLYITAKPDITVSNDDDKRAMIRVAAPENIDNLMAELSGVEVRITVVAGREAIEQVVVY